MKANSLINNIFNLYREFDLPANGNMGIDTSALGLIGDSPDADPDTPRRSRMKMKRRGAVLIPDRNGVFESETRKRKRGSNPRTPQKRPRIEGTRNSIHFNAVYQNRRAAKKHTIIRIPEDPVRPAKFYILRCEDHDIHFDDIPLQAGLAHLSEKHHHQNPSFETVVEHFGYEVIGCDDEKLIQNNKAAKEAFERGERGARDSIRVRTDSPSPERPRKNTSHAVKKSRSRRSRRKTQNSSDPHDLVAGDVYIIYWSASKQWYAGLYIPLQDPESVGIDESLEAMGLLSNIPPCYEYDSSSKSFSWAEGYEDGGPDASEQHFLFMFFEGLEFPDLNHVAWIPIGKIQRWDEEKALMIEHSDQAVEYLKQREAAQQRKRFSPDDEIPDSADDNSTLDLTPRSPVAESSTDFQCAQNAETVTPNAAQEAHAAYQAEEADATEQSEEAQKDTELEPEEAQGTQLESEKATQPPVQPDAVEDEDIIMSSPENPTESATQSPNEDSEDVVMETPEDATQEPLQQNDSKSNEDNQEIILNTQEDPAENVSSPKEPEEISVEREEESFPDEAREERLFSADLENLLLEGEDLEFQFSQSQQRDLNQNLTPTPAFETISLSRVANDVFNTKQEEISSTSPTLEKASLAQAENNSGNETREEIQLQRSSVATESSHDKTPQPRLSYAGMGRASSLSESLSSDVVDSRPQIQPASRQGRSGTPNHNALVAQSQMSSLSQSRVISRPPIMSLPMTIPSTSTAPPISTSLQLPMTSQPPTTSQPLVPRSPTRQRPSTGLQHPVSSWPLDNSWASTTPRRSGASQSSALARRPAPSQPTVTSQSPPSSQPPATRSPTSSRPPSSSQPSTSEPPLHAPTAQERPAAQVVMSPGPAVSNSEQPNNVRPTSQTSQALVPPRPSPVGNSSPEDAQTRSEVLRHPHAAQPKAYSQALVNSSQLSERPRVTRPKVSSKPSVDIVLLNRQAVSEAWSRPVTSGQQAATNSPTHMPAAHQRHSETPPVTSAARPEAPAPRRPLPRERPSPRPPVSTAKSHGAPQAMLSQDQAPSATSQHPFIAENTPGPQPEGPAQILSRQPPARYASQPTSPALQNSPRLPPMVVPQPASQLDGHCLPNSMLAQQQAALSMSRPGSAGHAGQRPMPSPSHAVAVAYPPGSASQGHIGSQPHASRRQASNEVLRPSSAYSGHPESQPMHSPHQAATGIQRSQSGFQGHPASQLMHSPRQVPGEIPHPASAYQGHPNHRPVPSPRGPYAVPVRLPGPPHHSFSHFSHQSHEMQGQGYIPQRHCPPTGTASPQFPGMENQLPPIRLSNIFRPRSGAQTAPNMISPPQTAVVGLPGHYMEHQQPAPHIMQSPRQSAAGIPRPHTANNMSCNIREFGNHHKAATR
ncbi:hypothetical protein FOFC_02317 [Fusarium oxysporum]|nr:hypothetical protein FOFC_02317 [Fusarium oxysporum]